MEETSNVKKTAKKIWSIWNTAEAVILLAAGVLAIVFGILYDKNNEPFNGNMETILTYSVASFVILDGLLRIIMSFLKQEQRTEESIMLVGGFEITLGVVVMVVLHEIFVETMVYFMAIGMIVIGLLFLIFSVLAIAKKANDKLFMPILEIIFGAILVGVGIFLIAAYNVDGDSKNRIALVLTGIVLSIVAIVQMVLTLISISKDKEKGKETKPVKAKDKKKESKSKQEDTREPAPSPEPNPEVLEAKVEEIEQKPVEQIEQKTNEDKK